jgi:hypothetical protein
MEGAGYVISTRQAERDDPFIYKPYTDVGMLKRYNVNV